MAAKRLLLSVGTALAVWPLVGCGEEPATRPVTGTREVAVTPGVKLGATSADRFGRMPMGGMGGGHSGDAADQGPALDWKVPAGWKELPPTAMRLANLQPATNAAAECYLSVLPKSGIAANVNRWRKQFSLAEVDDAAVAALPRQPLLKLDAVRVELEGTFAGMGGSETKANWALLGLMAELGDKMVFVKMTGPADVIAAERGRFDEFVASLDLGADAPTTDSLQPEPQLPDAAAPGGKQTSAQTVKFTLPDGWTREAEKPMRVATLRPGGTKESECVISVLASDGGGLGPNVNRWRTQQMGLAPLADREIAELAKTKILGVDAVLIDMLGTYSDSMNSRTIKQARMLGAIAVADGRSLFVKLTGPESEIDDKVRDAFRALCASITE